MPRDETRPQIFEVGPAGEMQIKYGWYAENWQEPKLDPTTVPPNLQDLIPFAQRWGVLCDITRHDVADKASPTELAKLSDALRGRHKDINDWLNSLPREPKKPWPDAAYHFMAMCVLEMEELKGPGLAGPNDP
jgi:hypothetical protein